MVRLARISPSTIDKAFCLFEFLGIYLQPAFDVLHFPQMSYPVAGHASGRIAQSGKQNGEYGVESHSHEGHQDGFGAEGKNASGQKGCQKHAYITIVEKKL